MAEISRKIQFGVHGIDCRGVILAEFELGCRAIGGTGAADENAGGRSGADGSYEFR
jgi:hypothetical protein